MKRKIFRQILVMFCFFTMLVGCEKFSHYETMEEKPQVGEKEIEENEHKKETTYTFDYVALGNSVTCNEIDEELWWGNWGMAATTKQNDYVHHITSQLKEKSDQKVSTTILDLKNWELSKDREKMLPYYKEYFSKDTDLVTIQTGENITEFKETLDTDYLKLVKYIKKRAPNAQILMLAEILWPSEDIEQAKKAACKRYDVTFVDMTEFLEDYEKLYKSEVGAEVMGADEKLHTVTNEVVAAHPNDEGMRCIAELVMQHIKFE